LALRPGRFGVHVSEWLPADKWVALSHRGEDVAEAMLSSDGGSFVLSFQVPRDRLDGADGSPPLSIEDLLAAAAVSTDEVERWDFGDASPPGAAQTLNEEDEAEPGGSPDATSVTLTVRLKPLVPRTASHEVMVGDVPPEKWQALDACWKTILGLEASIDTLRLSLDGLRAEMENAFKKTLGADEKLNALQADVIQWNKAKSRVHFAVPKVREFVHRATWAVAAAERKRIGDLIKSHVEPRIPFPDMDKEREQMEHLQKERQLMFAQGNAVGLEGRGLLAEIQRALSTLQRNAADKARAKRSAGKEKGKYF